MERVHRRFVLTPPIVCLYSTWTVFALHVLEPMVSGADGGGSIPLWDPTTGAADFVDFHASAEADPDHGLNAVPGSVLQKNRERMAAVPDSSRPTRSTARCRGSAYRPRPFDWRGRAFPCIHTSLPRPEPETQKTNTTTGLGSHTPHISVVDAEGRAVSLTETMGLYSGSAIHNNGAYLDNAAVNFTGPDERPGDNRRAGRRTPRSFAPAPVRHGCRVVSEDGRRCRRLEGRDASYGCALGERGPEDG